MKIKSHDRNLSRSMSSEEIRSLSFHHKKLSSEELVDRLSCGCRRDPGEFSVDEIYELARQGNERAQKLLGEFNAEGIKTGPFLRDIRTFD